jgi:hypothetical protein
MIMVQTRPLFSLGHVVATPGALAALRDAGQQAQDFLTRHSTGDWGDLTDEDWKANNFAVTRPLRLLSAYQLSTGMTLWIISEADRSATTLLLPSEY